MCYESGDVESIVEQSKPVEGEPTIPVILSKAIEYANQFQSNNLLEPRDFVKSI